MPWQNAQQNFNNGATPNGEKKRTNFRVGRLYGSDGILDISIWNSDSAVYTIFQIKQAIGKDPSTGANAYEQKAPNELPRIFMNLEFIRAFDEFVKIVEASSNDQFRGTFTPRAGSKLTIEGSKSGSFKIVLETDKLGTRTITFNAIPVGDTNVNSAWKNIGDLIGICVKKALYAKLDPEEFATAIGAVNDGDEAPI